MYPGLNEFSEGLLSAKYLEIGRVGLYLPEQIRLLIFCEPIVQE